MKSRLLIPAMGILLVLVLGGCDLGITVPTGISLNKSSLNLDGHVTEQLVAVVTPASAHDAPLVWTSSDPKIAIVNTDGMVTGIGAGTATVSAATRVGSRSASCAVTVTPVALVGVSLKTATTVIKDLTEVLQPVFTPANTLNQKVAWVSSAPSVATVSASGLVTGVAAGTATITMTTDEGARTATCVVTVVLPGSIAITVN